MGSPEVNKRYYAAHRDEILSRSKLYYSQHLEEQRLRVKMYGRKHREHRKLYAKTYKAAHPEIVRLSKAKSQAKRMRELREGVFGVYGSSCTCCGESRKEFLTLHHVNGGGTRDRREGGGNFLALRRAIIANDPSAYRVLCLNCHLGGIHYNGGICPHETERQKCHNPN